MPGSEFGHAYYKYYVFLRPEHIPPGLSRDVLLQALHERDVPAYSGICGEIYLEEAFEDSGFAPDERHLNARELSETAIMIPIHPNLSEGAVLDVANAIVDTLRQLSD